MENSYFVIDCTLSIPTKTWNKALREISDERGKTGKTIYHKEGIAKGLEHILDEDILQKIVGSGIQVEDVEDIDEYNSNEKIGGKEKEKPKSREEEVTEMGKAWGKD